MRGKRFRFSLDSVLKLRSHEAECARQDLAQIRHQIDVQEKKLKEAREALDTAVAARKTGSTGQRALLRMEAHRQVAHDRVEMERHKLERLKQREHDARLVLMQRKGAEETLRRLEEQERATFLKKYRTAETEQLDEQALSGYHRQRRAANS